MRDAPVEPLNVSAIIVTRGDQDLTAILDSIPEEWEKIVWDNGAETVDLFNGPWARKYGGGIVKESWPGKDLAVYGRYAAIEHASGDLIYVQDDDCVVSDPQALVECWRVSSWARQDYIVANQPQAFRHDFYSEHCLVGFGAVFHRDVPKRAFERFCSHHFYSYLTGGHWSPERIAHENIVHHGFRRTCDIVFTALTPRVLVDVPYENLPWADGPDRMYRQDEHVAERTRMLELVRKVRDAE